MNNDPQQTAPADAQLGREGLGDIVRESVVIEDRTFLIDRPRQAEGLIDRPALLRTAAAEDNLPYWAELWPGARMLGRAILREEWIPGTEALEIGCGLGLPGIVALSAGLRVTFSDIDATALRFASDNARLNGFNDFKTLRLDWRGPPNELQVPVLLASDLVYEVRSVEPVVKFIKKVLAPGGLCLLADQDRLPARAMREALEDSGLALATQVARAGAPGTRRVKGTLYRIQGSPL